MIDMIGRAVRIPPKKKQSRIAGFTALILTALSGWAFKARTPFVTTAKSAP